MHCKAGYYNIKDEKMERKRRLMLLGGNRYQLPVIKAAHDLGCYVITCDYLPDNIAHKYSDEYCNVSIIDKEAVLSAARRLDIDGIMSFACDPGVTVAAYVAEQLGLPSVGSYDAVCLLQNKGRFRTFLRDNGFNVPMAKRYTSLSDALKDTSLYHWPVMVKPTDSAGSKGVSKVDNVNDLPSAIEYALSRSFIKEFIIEDYLEKVGCSSDTDSFSINGELRFVSFNAQRFDLYAKNPYVPAAFSWPSTMSSAQEEELKNEIQRLIQLLHLKSSIYNIETRVCTDGKAYIMECTPRGGGNRLAEMIRYSTGVDLIKAAVQAALGDEITEVEQKSYSGYWAEIILHSDRSGTFDALWVDNVIGEYILEKDLWIKHGEHVEGFEGANNAIGTLILCFDNKDKMFGAMEKINEHYSVRVVADE